MDDCPARLMLDDICFVHGMIVSLMGHKIRTPNPCSEGTGSKMGRRDRLAEQTSIEPYEYINDY